MSGFIFKFNNKIFIGILLLVILLVSLNFVSAENPESDCLEPNLYLNDVNLNKDISVNDNVVADLNKDISVNDNVVADLNNDGSLNLNNVSSFSGNILNNASLSSVNDELSYTSLNIEDSNINSSYNSSRGVGEFTNFTFNGHVFNVSKVENNHFVISNEGNDLTGYIFNVKSEDDLKNISDSIKYSKVMDDIILINFYNDIYLTNIDTNVLFFNSRFIVINGNGFRIHTNRHFYYHFLTVGLNANVYIDN